MASRWSRLSLPAALIAAALVVALAACGGAANVDRAYDMWYSPLDEYLAPVWGLHLSQDEQQAAFDEWNLARQELIAQCMAQAGFDYILDLSSTQLVTFGGEGLEWRPEDRDWVEAWGYGLTRSPWDEHQADFQEHVALPNPNWEMVQGWPEAKQDAFWYALSGAPIDESTLPLDDDGNPIWPDGAWEQGGCEGWVQNELGSHWGSGVNPEELRASDEFASLFAAIDNIWLDMQNSPEIQVVNREWSQCMAGKGHPGLTERDDAFTLAITLINQSHGLEDRWAIEVAIALDDFDCREEVNWVQRQRDVRIALERQFIDDNHAALRALRSAAEQGR